MAVVSAQVVVMEGIRGVVAASPAGRGHASRTLDSQWLNVIITEGCWVWTGGQHKGYGRLWVDGRHVMAHRFFYELLVGPIPQGLEPDHACRNKLCVRPCPGHLELVTHAENNRRAGPFNRNALKTECPQGHKFTPENTYAPPKKPRSRCCRACRQIRGAHGQPTAV